MFQLRAVASLAAVTLLLAGCADDGGGTLEVAAVTLDADLDDAHEVLATEMTFDPDQLTVPVGSHTFLLVNEGRLPHDLVIDGTRVAHASPATRAAGVVELPAGTYELWCSVPGHRRAGMEATVEVTRD